MVEIAAFYIIKSELHHMIHDAKHYFFLCEYLCKTGWKKQVLSSLFLYRLVFQKNPEERGSTSM